MKKTIGYLAGAIVVALGLAGCFKTTQAFTISPDDTVSGEIVFALQKEFAEGMSDEDITNTLGGDADTSGYVNAKVEKYDDGDFVGTKLTFSDQPISETGDSGVTITHEGDTFRFDFPAGDVASESGLDASQLGDAVVTLSVTFPGPVSDTNGSVKGNTVTWDLLTFTDAPYAVGSAIPSGGGGGIPVWVWAIVAVVVLGAVGYFVMSSRSKGGAAPAPAPAPAPAAKPAAKASTTTAAKKAPAKKPAPKKES